MNGTAPTDPDIGQIVRAFEDASLDPAGFNHEAHILVGWWYLQEYSLLAAIERFTGALKALTRKLGLTRKYHETISWFYLIKIAERCSGAAAADWPAFRDANPDLFEWSPSLIQRYYSDSLLSSDSARRRFVLPDRCPSP